MAPIFRKIGYAFAAAILSSILPSAAHAQTKFEARYGVSFAGIPIGKGQWSVEFRPDAYTMTAGGSAGGMLTALISGEGAFGASGTIRDGKLSPTMFTSVLKRNDEKSETRMTLEGGNAKDVVAPPEPADKDRVKVTDAHHNGIVDPLSALMIHGSLDAQACQRTLPIFDGRRRYDLKLSFKRMDKVKADKGYAGSALVCATAFQPIAGHRANSSLAKYLTEGRDIEIWLAPVAGTPLLAPFRLSISSLLGNMVITASQFETSPALAKAQ